MDAPFHGRNDLLSREQANQFLLRGRDLEDGAHYDEALRCFEAGYNVDPNEPELLYSLAYAYQHAYGATPELDEEWQPYLDKSLDLYEKAAALGQIEAYFELGNIYSGREITCLNVDHEQAAKWYRRAAERGHARAQSLLADCYANGIGVRRDFDEAVAWLRKAAEQGDADAPPTKIDRIKLG
jgi:TPR repeat protein